MSATKEYYHNEIEAGQRGQSSLVKEVANEESRRISKSPAPIAGGPPPFPKGDVKKEHPILFSTPMVQAELEDRKNQTRRTTGLDKINEEPGIYEYHGTLKDNPLIHVFARIWKGTHVETIHIKCPYGQPGDLLWVREKFRFQEAFDYDGEHYPEQYWYYASVAEKWLDFDGDVDYRDDYKWKPSIHMPKAAARIWLEITDIKVERVQSISEEDAKAEGIEKYGPFGKFKGSRHPGGGMMQFRAYSKAARAFQDLWQDINGEESWNSNPWVWVIKFKVISTTGKPKTL